MANPILERSLKILVAIISCGCLLLPLRSNSQAFAEVEVQTLFNSHKLRGIYLQAVTASDRELVAVGEYGTIVHCALGEVFGCSEQVVPDSKQMTAVLVADGRIWSAGLDAEIQVLDPGTAHWQSKFSDLHLQGEVVLNLRRSPAGIFWGVGSNGLVLRSADQGETWEVLRVADPSGFRPHLFGVYTDNDSVYIVGEKGVVFDIAADANPSDGELKAAPMDIGYNGSLFGVERSGDGRLVLYGMNGNVFVETGEGFDRYRLGAGKSLLGAAKTPEGELYLVGLDGVFAHYRDGTLEVCNLASPTQLTDVAVLGGRVIASGFGGLYQMPAASIDHCQ